MNQTRHWPMQRYWHRISSITTDGAETASVIWDAWTEIAGWMVLLWLLLVTSTTQGYLPLLDEIFHFDIAEKFWPVFKLSWPVAVASSLGFVVVSWFWKATAGQLLGARILAVCFGSFWGLVVTAAFLMFVAVPILVLLGQDITPLTGKECPGELTYVQALQQCWLAGGREGHRILDFLAGFAALYGRTNFVLALGLGLFLALLIGRILGRKHRRHRAVLAG
jgi:hypothetical protein